MGTLSVLQIVQEFCGLRGLPVPSALVGSNETSVVQYRAILNAVLREAAEKPWPETKVRGTFTTVATANQGVLSTLFPGFSSLVKDTFWLDSETLPVQGPLTDATWATLTALDISGPPYSYWLSGSDLYLTPTPPAGLTASAIYHTDWKYFAGASPQQSITLDSNTCVVPDDVMLAGFEAIWLQKKGLSWQAAWNDFQSKLAHSLAPTQPTLQLDAPPNLTRPSIYIPPGNWKIP